MDIKKIINIAIALSVFYNSGYEHGYATQTSFDRSNQRMDIYNPNRSMPTSVDLRPTGTGSYSGTTYDMNTRKFMNVNVNQYGRVDIFEY